MIYKNELIKVVNKSLERDYSTEKIIETASVAAICSIKSTAHGYATGDYIWIKDALGMLDLNNKHYTVTKVDADNFTIGVDSSGYDAYTANSGTCIRDDLDAEIIATLKDLSQLGNFLQGEFKRQTIADRDYYNLPTNLKDLLFCGMKSSDDATRYKPLVYERFEMYKRNIYYSSTTGTPTRYTWQSGFMYPRPIPDDAYNMYCWYSYYHPKIVTVDSVEYKACDYILFDDIYQDAIEMGLLYRVALGLGLDNDVKKFLGLYMTQVGIRNFNIKKHPSIIAYRDGF